MTDDPMEKRQCSAKSKQSGQQCRRVATPGTTVCASHGSKAPQVRAKAAERLAEAAEQKEIRSVLERLGKPTPLGNPVDELLAIGAEARAWQVVVRERVADLSSLVTQDVLHVEREKALVGIYERSLDRTSRLLSDLVRLNLDARRLALDEQQTELVFRALSTALGVVPKQFHESARRALVAALRSEV